MAAPSVTYTFTNSTTADATQVNQNFTDLINGVSDGTKDLSIAALTVAGSATLNGNVTLGNASTDDLTVTASLASTIPIKTTGTYDIGSATLGIRTAYFGNTSNSNTVGLKAGTTSSSYTLDLPTAAPSASGNFVKASSTSALKFESFGCNVATKTTTATLTGNEEVVLCSASSADYTITLPSAAAQTGKIFKIIRTDAYDTYEITLDAYGSETIGGLSDVSLWTPNESWEIISDGTNWQVLNHNCNTVWTSFSSTISGPTSVTGAAYYWKRVGDSIAVEGSFSLDTVGTWSTMEMTIPSGLSIDTGKFADNSAFKSFGVWVVDRSTDYVGSLAYASTTQLRFIMHYVRTDDAGISVDGVRYANHSSSALFTAASGDDYTMTTFLIPVTDFDG